MDASPDLSIIIVNWNSREFLRKCLLSLRAAGSSVAYEVIVVDNASYDGCEEMLRSEFTNVLFVQAGANLGFARGNNLGVTHSKGRELLFLNPDTEVVGSALSTLVATGRADQKVGIVGARLLNSDGSLQIESVKAFPTIANQVLEFQFLQKRFPQLKLWGIGPLFSGRGAPTAVDVVSGACLLIKRTVFDAVGGFSERYFMYSEDVDLCWKVKRGGWEVMLARDATVIHHGGGSSSLAPVSQFSAVLIRESRFRFFRHSKGVGYSALYRCAIALSAVGRLAVLIVAYPVLRMTGAVSSANSIAKWLHVLGWALGLESWARTTP